jgi:hypothetical protein
MSSSNHVSVLDCCVIMAISVVFPCDSAIVLDVSLDFSILLHLNLKVQNLVTVLWYSYFVLNISMLKATYDSDFLSSKL